MKEKTFTYCVKEKPLSKNKIRFGIDIYMRFKPLVQADQESFWVIGLNSRNMEIYQDCLFIGGIAQCAIDPKIIFKRLIAVGASAFIVLHNHPGGECSPSEDDMLITNQIERGANFLGLNFLDHLIMADDGCYSIKGSCSVTEGFGL